MKDKSELEKILVDQSNDTELSKMAETELKDLQIQHEKEKVKIIFITQRWADKKNAIIEIRAGTGGLKQVICRII